MEMCEYKKARSLGSKFTHSRGFRSCLIENVGGIFGGNLCYLKSYFFAIKALRCLMFAVEKENSEKNLIWSHCYQNWNGTVSKNSWGNWDNRSNYRDQSTEIDVCSNFVMKIKLSLALSEISNRTSKPDADSRSNKYHIWDYFLVIWRN